MNTKIKKVLAEIEQTESKIASLEARVKNLYQEKTKLEDLEIVDRFRSIKVDTYNIDDYVDTLKKLKNGQYDKLDNKKLEKQNVDVTEENFNENF